VEIFKDKSSWKNPFYTLGEEIANSVTHGVGVALAIAGMIVLISLAVIYGDIWEVVSFSVYGASLLILYSASTLYHTVQHPPVKRILRTMDHASIYILIAGTYTPFLMIATSGKIRLTLLVIVWLMAALGVVWKIFFLGRFEVITTIMYIVMGWMGVLAYGEMLVNVPRLSVLMLFAGGIIYTTGVIFYAWEAMPYNHAVWHVFVLGGSICHFVAVITLL
jgi:hemolysin III